MNTNTTAPQWSLLLTYVSLAIVICVIVLGSWTRLADAGLGCPDWPGCYGSLVVPQTSLEFLQLKPSTPMHPLRLERAGWR
jgi:cytochrome c oxidase assembly protein subunit 15